MTTDNSSTAGGEAPDLSVPNSAPSEAKRLHQKGEPRLLPDHLYSMLDLMGASATCDKCGAWQRIDALSMTAARAESARLGWVSRDGIDLCVNCAADGKASAPQASAERSVANSIREDL